MRQGTWERRTGGTLATRQDAGCTCRVEDGGHTRVHLCGRSDVQGACAECGQPAGTRAAARGAPACGTCGAAVVRADRRDWASRHDGIDQAEADRRTRAQALADHTRLYTSPLQRVREAQSGRTDSAPSPSSGPLSPLQRVREARAREVATMRADSTDGTTAEPAGRSPLQRAQAVRKTRYGGDR